MAIEGTVEKLREFYFDLEDKWYGAIDKIDTKIPIHGVIDRVDKVVPSFAVFLVLVALLLVALIIPLFMQQGAVFSFKATDQDGDPLEDATVTVYVEGEELFNTTTNEAGETGQFSVPLGAKITIAALKTGFEDYTETLEVTGSIFLHSLIMLSLEDKTYTIALKDSLGQPIRTATTLSFTCRNSGVTPPADLTISTGTATVTEPAGCGGLLAAIRGEGFQFKDSVELVQNQQTIYLQEELGDLATIDVELSFNGQLISEEVTVYIYKDNGTDSGLGPLESTISQNGRAQFERSADTYFIKTSAMAGYAAATSITFSVTAASQRTIEIDLQQNIVGTVRLRIVDADTGGSVDGANVILRIGSEEVDTKISSADEDGLIEFPVIQDTAYTAVIDHEAYCLHTVHDARIGSAAREIELVPFTEDCGGKLKVKVLDQDGEPVTNATVGLYNENGFNVGFANIISDANGVAEFSRAPSGDYKAFAFKASSSGWSDPAHFIQRAADKTILTVVLIAGDGSIKVNVLDKEGAPLQFAQVAFIDALT
ncbi:MAG: hypothetical protein JRE40_13465, partial [Deltaproteobacteria bacterium]|nr:hypothetical protein [Deltaproteobacteria bacterium]